ncbi:MAG TPA: hypothetical protein VJY54_04000, partial [Lachnospiraceae bacterium]|nr:hypothetical protein [Lachnospiraceae bacterium]
ALLTFDLHFRYEYLLLHKEEKGLSYWQLMFKEQNIFMFIELLAVFCTLLIFVMFNIETKYRGWINIKLSNKSMISVVVSKFLMVIIFMTILIIFNCGSMVLVGHITGVKTPVEWGLFGKVFAAQWITAIGVSSLNFLIIAMIRKIIFLIPISFIIFMVSSQLQRVDSIFISKINPYAFASYSYMQSTRLIMEHTAVVLIGAVVCLFLSAVLLNRKDELV